MANPILLYVCVALGGFGVAMTLPRPKLSPQVIGALLAAVGLGGAFLALGLKAGAERPGFYFYVFAAIALGSAVRVISHPRPVYAALYFILTILASSALYLMLGAEFMAFALIIIYAGAILITYLFVIMLAEQTPEGAEVGVASEYDRYSREPGVATVVGFVLLALLTGMMARGMKTIEPASPRGEGIGLLARMPKKVIEAYDRLGVLEPRGGFARPEVSGVASRLSTSAGTMSLTVADVEKVRKNLDDPRVAALFGEEMAAGVRATVQSGQTLTLRLPGDLRAENLDGVGFALIAEHPMALELAGVILLMAMLGAVVLARKQIEMSEAEKAAAARPSH
ncbi:MAG: NADH-quinone oxidoreductase subunit J [Phycisphaerae bacterium]|nr:NADH-quinone oxidoreductase subunit J [Phycisphaerae bacterium]